MDIREAARIDMFQRETKRGRKWHRDRTQARIQVGLSSVALLAIFVLFIWIRVVQGSEKQSSADKLCD